MPGVAEWRKGRKMMGHDIDEPGGPRLGWSDPAGALTSDRGPPDPKGTSERVEVVEIERGQLAEPGTRIHRREDQGLIAGIHHFGVPCSAR